MNYSNNNQVEALKRSIDEDRLSHAYIICGGDAGSRSVFIDNTLKHIFCLNKDISPCGNCNNCRKIEHGNMEDITYIEKNGTTIRVDQIKEMSALLASRPFTERNVVVINDADAMTPESQNKLLKNLEEPAPGTVIILSVNSLFALFPTVRSRCVIVNLGSNYREFDPELEEKASDIVKYSMSNKPLSVIYSEVSNCASSGAEAAELLDAMEMFLRDVLVGRYSKNLLSNEKNGDVVDRIDWSKGFHFREYLNHVENAKQDIKRNINWKYVMKDLIISFKQEETHG